MKPATERLRFKYETPGKWRFDAEKGGGRIQSLYVAKKPGESPPEQIEITITPK